MKDARELLDEQFVQMRQRCVSLAADFDRIARAAGGLPAVDTDSRLQALRQSLAIVAADAPQRAARVLEVLSDR